MGLTLEDRRRGGKTRAKAFTPEYQRWARSHLSPAQAARNGMRGYQAAVQKYGAAFLFERSRQYRLEHPSAPEREVMAILDSLSVRYEREYVIAECTSVDFGWPERKQAIEVNGKVHYDPLFDDPVFTGRRSRREAERLARLTESGWKLLVIDYRDVDRDREGVKRRIAEFLATEVGNGESVSDLQGANVTGETVPRRYDAAMV